MLAGRIDVHGFPFIAHRGGWSARDMERNVALVQRSPSLREGVRAPAVRTAEKARELIGHDPVVKAERAGRKALKMEILEIE
jgi:hypothetical protein